MMEWKSLFKESSMKKIIASLLAVLALGSNAAFACQTQTIIVNGKVIICTYCPNYVMCT